MARKYFSILLNLGWFVIAFWSEALPAYGQSQLVRPDDTTQTVISGGVACRENCVVSGGSRAGSSLFHSFHTFGIPENVTVAFVDGEAANIFVRVSDEASRIDGTLAVAAEANFFLINPHGISFGSQALLLSEGSFIASTAESILFPEGAFSASQSNPPLLTVSAPIGLRFGHRPGAIVNRSQAFFPGGNTLGAPSGLRVDAGRTLALVGGSVHLAGGKLTARGGQIAVGSVAAGSDVSLSSDLTLGYENVSTFEDILLTDNAIVDVSGERGRIDMRSHNFTLADQSALFNRSTGLSPGTIQLSIEASTHLSGVGIFFSPADDSLSRSADLNIVTRRLTLQAGTILSGETFGSGNGGDIFIDALESVEIGGTSRFSPSLITTSTQGTGTGGDITINTQRFINRGGIVAVNSVNSGATGNVEINARTVILSEGAKIVAMAAAGNGGNIRLRNLETLLMRGGSEISARADTGDGIGNGGNIDIVADFIVAEPQTDNDIIASAARGRGGNIAIDTQGLYGIAERQAVPGNGTNDIDASSDFGVSGLIVVNQLTPSADQRLVVLSSRPLESADLVTQGCAATGDRFIVTGRGGLPAAPTDVAEISAPLVDLGDRYAVGSYLPEQDSSSVRPQLSATGSSVTGRPAAMTGLAASPWVEARGWTRNQDNQVVLTASLRQETLSSQSVAACTG